MLGQRTRHSSDPRGHQLTIIIMTIARLHVSWIYHRRAQEHREDLGLSTDQVLHPLEAGLPLEPEEAEGPVEAASHGDGAEQREHDEGLLER